MIEKTHLKLIKAKNEFRNRIKPVTICGQPQALVNPILFFFGCASGHNQIDLKSNGNV